MADQLPNDVKEVLKLLKEAQDLPSSTKDERGERDARIHEITNHLHAIQQGPATPVVDSSTMRGISDAQNEAAEQLAVESLARQFPVIQKLVDKLESANTEIKKLKKNQNK